MPEKNGRKARPFAGNLAANCRLPVVFIIFAPLRKAALLPKAAFLPAPLLSLAKNDAMFNRRFIREKAVQAYFGFCQGGSENALACQKNMLAGLDQTAELYYLQLSFLITLSDYAAQHYEPAIQRGRRQEEELEGMRLMASNKVVEKLRTDSNLSLKSTQYKFSWKDRQKDLTKAVYESLFLSSEGSSIAGRLQSALKETLQGKPGMEDLSEEEKDFALHKEFLKRLYRKKISTHPVLCSFCEERSLYWEADYEPACFWAYTTLSQMQPEGTAQVDPGWTIDDEVVVFGKTLLEKTLLHQDEYNGYIASHLTNWKPERVGATERVLLGMAVSELLNFPSIPVKVTLNEYIELSKRFCTPESASFVNGVLNQVAQDLQAEKKIKKSGRGLIG